MEKWHCYIICNKNSTYVGVSPDPNRRIRQHNGEIRGGAKYTSSKGPGWTFMCVVTGFDKISSLQFEWAVKHCKPKGVGGPENRIKKLLHILNKEKWTRNSRDAQLFNLTLHWHNIKYRPNDIQLPSWVVEENIGDSSTRVLRF